MELIKGEIYYYKGWGSSYIFEVTNKTTDNIHLDINKKELSHHGWDFWTSEKIFDLRLATNIEKQWLNACIATNKYVKCPKEENILINLEIW